MGPERLGEGDEGGTSKENENTRHEECPALGG